MDSVYDAAVKHADALKAELKSLQAYMDLHDHFRERFGLTAPAAATEALPAEAEAPESDASESVAPHIESEATTNEAVGSTHDDEPAHHAASHGEFEADVEPSTTSYSD